MARLKRVCEWLLRRRYPAMLILAGWLLALPSLWGGLQLDDYTIRATVLDSQPWGVAIADPWDPFSFLDGDPQRNHALMDRGVMPWWCDQECRLAFLRPLTTATHMADHHLWPGRPMLMHVQSLVWFALLIWAAAVLYRRLMGRSLAPWMAALAALMFTLDDAHGSPVGWLANRNSLLAGLFGILALIAYDRWRHDGWRGGAVLAPVALLAALLSKEAAVCTAAYLLAYAIFLDRGSWRRRLAALLPCLAVGAAWYLSLKMLGYGALRSGVYIDPAHDPARFAGQVFNGAPLLLLGQWGFPGSDLSLFWSAWALRIHWAWAIVFLILLGVLLAPLLARSGLARFWALGMVLSVLPACVVPAGDRLLMFVGLGAMGLLAQWLGGWKEGAAWLGTSPVWRRLAGVFGVLFIAVHLVISPLAFPVSSNVMRLIGNRLEGLVSTLPTDPEIEQQTVVFVNSSSWIGDTAMIQTRHYRGQRLPKRILSLSTYCPSATLKRTGVKTLVVRPRGGFIPPRGWSPDGWPPAIAPAEIHRVIDLLLRSEERPMALGETIELTAATIEITDLTADGRPAEATFRFGVQLEDRSLRWLQETEEGYAPFTPPAIGQTVEVTFFP